jgi:hypothetical protein
MMAKALSKLTLIGTVLTIGGSTCGGGRSNTSGVVSCTMESRDVFGVVMTCEEMQASYRSLLQQDCVLTADAGLGTAGISAHLTDGPCSHANALGGCEVTNSGVTVTTWYYQSNGVGGLTDTPASIQTMCSGIGTFVAP